MSDHERYRRYCDYCSRIGVRPARFSAWLATSKDIPEWWNAIRRDLMIRGTAR